MTGQCRLNIYMVKMFFEIMFSCFLTISFIILSIYLDISIFLCRLA